MAVVATYASKLCIGGWNASANLNAISPFGVEVPDLNITTFANAPFEAVTPGLKKVMIGPAGYNDFAAGASAELLRAQFGTVRVASCAPEGDVAANLAVMTQGLVSRNSLISAKVGEVPTLDIKLAGVTTIAEGKVTLDGATTRTTTVNGTANQLGAVSATQKVYAACHLVTFGGTITSVTFSLQSDTVGFPSPTTIATGSALTAVGDTWLSVAGALTDDYYRVVATVAGGAPSYVVFCSTGIA